jgi:hypothetical protein
MHALRVLNIAGVGLALSAMTGAVFSNILEHAGHSAGVITAIPTLIIGTLWAALLRSRATLTGARIRVGWILSLPFAIANAGFASAIYFALHDGLEKFFIGGVLGATFGAVFWIPALVLTLLCFGFPIYRAQALAKKGLAGEERGEWMVGLVSLAISALALGLATQRTVATPAGRLDSGVFVILLAALGMASGGLASTLAFARELRRRRFVRAAGEGKLQGYRVDATPEGKVLVRIGAAGRGYRVADFEEDVFELSEEGEATKPAAMVMPSGECEDVR